MYIKKQRLLTPGPTPLLPRALHAMMASDIHHRTQDFIKLYPTVLRDLKEVFGTQGDVLITVSSGTGALEASITNFFSEGDKVVICCAGKFGERWVELAKAFHLNAVVLMAEYGSVVSPAAVEAALNENPDTTGVLFQASETSTGAAHDVKAIGEITKKTGQSVVLSESVDPEIVGGLVLKVGELVVDGSVRHDLDRLAERLHSVSVDAALAPS